MPYYRNGPLLVWYDPDKPGPRPRILTPHGLMTVKGDHGRRVIEPWLEDETSGDPGRVRDTTVRGPADGP